MTVRYLRSTLNPVKITPVRRSTRSKAVIQQVESVEPQVDAKLRTDENPEREKLVAEDVSPEENENANKMLMKLQVLNVEVLNSLELQK